MKKSANENIYTNTFIVQEGLNQLRCVCERVCIRLSEGSESIPFFLCKLRRTVAGIILCLCGYLKPLMNERHQHNGMALHSDNV